MKKFAYIILSIVVVSVFANSSVLAQAKKAEPNQTAAAAAETKITKDAAQKLVLQKYVGAKVLSCDLNKDNSAWIVTFTRTGGNIGEKVMVDAQTGKVTRL